MSNRLEFLIYLSFQLFLKEAVFSMLYAAVLNPAVLFGIQLSLMTSGGFVIAIRNISH